MAKKAAASAAQEVEHDVVVVAADRAGVRAGQRELAAVQHLGLGELPQLLVAAEGQRVVGLRRAPDRKAAPPPPAPPAPLLDPADTNTSKTGTLQQRSTRAGMNAGGIAVPGGTGLYAQQLLRFSSVSAGRVRVPSPALRRSVPQPAYTAAYAGLDPVGAVLRRAEAAPAIPPQGWPDHLDLL